MECHKLSFLLYREAYQSLREEIVDRTNEVLEPLGIGIPFKLDLTQVLIDKKIRTGFYTTYYSLWEYTRKGEFRVYEKFVGFMNIEIQTRPIPCSVELNLVLEKGEIAEEKIGDITEELEKSIEDLKGHIWTAGPPVKYLERTYKKQIELARKTKPEKEHLLLKTPLDIDPDTKLAYKTLIEKIPKAKIENVIKDILSALLKYKWTDKKDYTAITKSIIKIIENASGDKTNCDLLFKRIRAHQEYIKIKLSDTSEEELITRVTLPIVIGIVFDLISKAWKK